jgi:hypothetical protein
MSRHRTVDYSELERAFAAGKSNQQIASEFPLTCSWVSKLKASMGFRVPTKPRHFKASTNEHFNPVKAMQHWNDGGNDRRIAGQCQVSVSRVVHWREENGLKENKRT